MTERKEGVSGVNTGGGGGRCKKKKGSVKSEDNRGTRAESKGV